MRVLGSGLRVLAVHLFWLAAVFWWRLDSWREPPLRANVRPLIAWSQLPKIGAGMFLFQHLFGWGNRNSFLRKSTRVGSDKRACIHEWRICRLVGTEHADYRLRYSGRGFPHADVDRHALASRLASVRNTSQILELTGRVHLANHQTEALTARIIL